MDFNWLLVLAVVWFLLNLISNARRKPQAPSGPRSQDRLRPRPLPSAPDPTQQEGSRLELVLRELQRSLEEAAGVPAPRPLPPEQSYDESQSLEVEPEIISLEEGVHREARRRVDQDDDAAEIETRRIQAAAARDSARSQVARIVEETPVRQEPADHTATRGYTTKQLRDAVVWREILGPPVGLRGE